MKDNIATPKGSLEIFSVQDGKWELLRKLNNMVLYTGADILASTLAGLNKGVNGMYLEYNNNTPSAPSITRERDRSYYEGLSSPAGYVRVPTIANPSLTASDENYTGKVVQFIGVTDGSIVNGPGIIDGTSAYYSCSLVSMPDSLDRTQDVIFSAANITDSNDLLSPIIKVANAQIGIKWVIQFT